MRYFYYMCWLLFVPLQGQGQTLQCIVDPLAAWTGMGGDPDDKTIYVQADNSLGNYQRADFTGSVELHQGDKHLFAPHLVYKHEQGKAELNEGGIFASPNFVLDGIKGHYDSNSGAVIFDRAQYYISGKQQAAVGAAETAQFDLADRRDTFTGVTWSTCSRTDPAWHLRAESLLLDYQDNRGVARDMTLNIGQIPVLYLPYFTFPLSSMRQSGFLTPSVGTSEERGLALSVPYYWNIAPNQDATFVLHPMSKRGLMFEGEYRFMSSAQQASLNATLLPYDRQSPARPRWSARLQQHYRFSEQWFSNIDYQTVSDTAYINDFNSDFSIYDDWYLQRHATLHGNTPYGNVMLRLQDYQRIDKQVDAGQKPYSRLPQFTYEYSRQANHWRYDADAEAVRFYRPQTGAANRFSLNNTLFYRAGAEYGYLEPGIGVNAVHYDLSRWKKRGRQTQISRILPTLSLDGKMVFERQLTFQGENWTQTLEPRLFYLYTPYKNQDNIPVFDTDDVSLSWSGLFARNRFSGTDRIGDSNQLTTAVSSRWYRGGDGAEKLRLSLGQIQYFRNRKVSLNGTQNATGRSVLVSEGIYHIDRHWRLYGLSFWDTDIHRNERDVLSLDYHLDDERFFSLSHHYNRQDYDQMTFAGVWRFNPRWRGFLRQDYSARQHRPFNTVVGVEYNDCCWAWRLAGKHYRQTPESDELHNALYLEFVLKGLGNMGSRSGSMLSKEINGFKPLAEEKEF